MDEVFKFLGGKIVSHPSSNKSGAPELYLKWEFPEEFKQYNHPTWKKPPLEEDWNFLITVIEKISTFTIEDNIVRDNSVIPYVNHLGQAKRGLLKLNKELTLEGIKSFVRWYNNK